MSSDSILKVKEIIHLNSLGGNFLYKLTQHPKQYIYHNEGGECFAITTIIWNHECQDVVQVHQEYYSKCTPNRLAHIVDGFDYLRELLKGQGITKVLTCSDRCDKKMKRYWKLLGFDESCVVDNSTIGFMEI
jgi:hypothetical protein